MKISSNTGTLGLIGSPVQHSKSPEMMNVALQALGVPYVYLAYEVTPGKLPQAVEGLKALQFKGWNVTIPHKVAMMDVLDDLDTSAKEIGAVNTVVCYDGKWVGHNTDGAGYLRSLKEETGLILEKQRVVLLGAGGAARAVGYALAKAGVQNITIANRTLEKAEQLAKHLSRWTSTRAITIQGSELAVRKSTLVINTTSVGMSPYILNTPIEPGWIDEHHVVSDLVYNPRYTAFLQAARQKGAQIHTGEGMLVHQAAIALELWLGKQAPINQMKQVLEATLTDKSRREHE